MTIHYLGDADPVDDLQKMADALPDDAVSDKAKNAQAGVYSALAQIQALTPPVAHDEWEKGRADLPVVFRGINRGGESRAIPPGAHSMKGTGLDDRISSIHVPPWWQVAVTRNADGGGGAKTLRTGATPVTVNLQGTGFNDNISRVVVVNLWPKHWGTVVSNYNKLVKSLDDYLDKSINLWEKYLKDSKAKYEAVIHKGATEDEISAISDQIIKSDLDKLLTARDLAERGMSGPRITGGIPKVAILGGLGIVGVVALLMLKKKG